MTDSSRLGRHTQSFEPASTSKVRELFLYDDEKRGATFYISIILGGIPVLAVIDCAAQASVMNQEMFKKFG